MRVLLFVLLGSAAALRVAPQGNANSVMEMDTGTDSHVVRTLSEFTAEETVPVPNSVQDVLRMNGVSDNFGMMKSMQIASSKYFDFLNRQKKTITSEAWNGAQAFNEQATSGKVLEKLKGKHVVFLGDSVTRYQYLNLAHVLLHGKPPDYPFLHSDGPQAADKATHWNLWYNESNKRLQSPRGSEICDCWRGDETKGEVIENRFLQMPKENVSVTYLPWLDDMQTFKGHWSPAQGYPIKTGCPIGSCSPESIQWMSSQNGDGTVEFLKSFVMKLEPTPTHIVMNRGIWGGFVQEQALQNIFATGEELKKDYPNTNFIWKTTNKQLLDIDGSKPFQAETEVNHATEHGWKAVDLWKKSEGMEGWYYDPMHPNEQGMAYFNGLLMDMI